MLQLPYFPSRSKEYQRIWHRVHSDSQRRFRRTDEDKRLYIRDYNRNPLVKEKNRRSKARLSVLNLLGAECVKCGFRDLRALQLDHINGDGKKDVSDRRTSGYYRKILENPIESMKKFQILCANCNWIKRYENQEAKHTFPYGVF